MSTITMPAHGLAGGKASCTNEMSSWDQADARQEPTASKPSPEAIGQHLMPTTPTTSEEDASGQILRNQTAKKSTCEIAGNKVQLQKHGIDRETVGASGDGEDSVAASTDAGTDPKSTKRTARGNPKKIFTTGEPSDYDSQDNFEIDGQVKEEEDVAYTVEGQKVFQQRAGRRIRHLGLCYRSVEYRMRSIESELEKLGGDDSKSKPKDDTEQVSATPSKVIPGIRRLTWAESKPSLKPQELSKFGTPEASHRFTWQRRKVRLNLQKKKANLLLRKPPATSMMELLEQQVDTSTMSWKSSLKTPEYTGGAGSRNILMMKLSIKLPAEMPEHIRRVTWLPHRVRRPPSSVRKE